MSDILTVVLEVSEEVSVEVPDDPDDPDFPDDFPARACPAKHATVKRDAVKNFILTFQKNFGARMMNA